MLLGLAQPVFAFTHNDPHDPESLKACPCQFGEVNLPLVKLTAVHDAVHEVIVGLFGINAPPHVAKSCIRTMPKSIA